MYLDANFFIFANFDNGQKGNGARKIHAQIVAGKPAVTSVLTIDELMWVMIKNGKKELIRQVIEEIYSIPALMVKEVPALTALTAIDFMEKYGLKPRDAFHAAIMKSLGLTEIVTDDSDFDRIEWIKRIRF